MQYTSQRKDEIVLRLAALGVAKCVVSYSGCGDNGAIDAVEAFLTIGSEDPHNVDRLARRLETDKAKIVINVRDRLLDRKTTEFSTQIEDLAYDALNAAQVGDWINNDGGRGVLTINVKDNNIKIEHEAYGETVYENEDDDEGDEGESEHSTHYLD